MAVEDRFIPRFSSSTADTLRRAKRVCRILLSIRTRATLRHESAPLTGSHRTSSSAADSVFTTSTTRSTSFATRSTSRRSCAGRNCRARLLVGQGLNVNSIYTFQNPTANSSAAGADTQLTTLDGFNPDYPTMRLYSWNFTIEKDLGAGLGLRTSYVGNIGRHLSRSVRINACAPGPTECLSRPASDRTARKLPQFGIDAGQRAGDGESNYNAWEVELQKRFSNGLLFDVNYAWTRAFSLQYQASDPVSNPLSRYDYGPVPAQPRSVFHWNYVYELPFGRGKRWGSSMNPVVAGIFGGWQLSGIGTWQSGTALTVTAGVGQSPTGATANRADRVADGKRDHDGLSRGEKAFQWFDTSRLPGPGLRRSRCDPSDAPVWQRGSRHCLRSELLHIRCHRPEELLHRGEVQASDESGSVQSFQCCDARRSRYECVQRQLRTDPHIQRELYAA